MAAAPLDDDEMAQVLASLPAWELREGALQRSLTFHDFSEAWAFMSRVALIAEASNHHPDWSNSWNRVEISLVTHDAGGVTRQDADFARRIDELATSR